jgi:hypothetical protein
MFVMEIYVIGHIKGSILEHRVYTEYTLPLGINVCLAAETKLMST